MSDCLFLSVFFDFHPLKKGENLVLCRCRECYHCGIPQNRIISMSNIQTTGYHEVISSKSIQKLKRQRGRCSCQSRKSGTTCKITAQDKSSMKGIVVDRKQGCRRKIILH